MCTNLGKYSLKYIIKVQPIYVQKNKIQFYMAHFILSYIWWMGEV